MKKVLIVEGPYQNYESFLAQATTNNRNIMGNMISTGKASKQKK